MDLVVLGPAGRRVEGPEQHHNVHVGSETKCKGHKSSLNCVLYLFWINMSTCTFVVH